MATGRWRYGWSWAAAMAPVLFAALLYAALAPPSTDLAAQMFRSRLFDANGFLLWNNYWYGGHNLLGYSLLFPPLGATVGVTAIGALSAIGSTGLFGLLARGRYGSRARLATLWFGAGMIAMLLSGRLTFALGVTLGLAALLALQRRLLPLAAPLAAATSLASPVAGFFLLPIGAALALGDDRRGGALLMAGAATPIALMALAFYDSGTEPFVFSSALGTLAVAALVYLLLPPGERLLRRGVALYAAAAACVFVVPTALGGNVARLSNLLAGPLLVLGLAGPRRRLLLALCAVPLLYWQWQGAVRDVSRALADPSVERAYYAPLLAELERRTPAGSPVRIQIPPTLDRWEAYYVPPRFLLARGWERQQETAEAQLFRSQLTPHSYRAWLRSQGVRYVAVPSAPLDYLGKREAGLIGAGLPYLRPVWDNADWRLYAVRGATGLVEPLAGGGEASMRRLRHDGFALDVRRPGRFLVRVRFTPYWSVSQGAGCLLRRGEWTVARVARPGVFRVAANFSVPRAWRAATGARKTC